MCAIVNSFIHHREFALIYCFFDVCESNYEECLLISHIRAHISLFLLSIVSVYTSGIFHDFLKVYILMLKRVHSNDCCDPFGGVASNHLSCLSAWIENESPTQETTKICIWLLLWFDIKICYNWHWYWVYLEYVIVKQKYLSCHLTQLEPSNFFKLRKYLSANQRY